MENHKNSEYKGITRINDGKAIVGVVVVPASEMKVFDVLLHSEKALTVPEIEKKITGKYSHASLYKYMERLLSRKLVLREEVLIDVFGTKIKRIRWSISEDLRNKLKQPV